MHKANEVKNALNYNGKLFGLNEENKKSKSAEICENICVEAQQIKEPEPSYYAVIPANVRYDTRLSPLAKLLYGEITCFCQKEGFCWATNAYFEKLYEKSERQIIRIINQLVEYGYIYRVVEYDEKTKQMKKRQLRLSTAEK